MGNKLKSRRKELKKSISDISKITGLSTTYLSNLENENRVNPTKENMDKIAKALESTVPEIFY